MFDHVALTVADLERSRAFYAHALAPLGITELATFDGSIGFGREHPQFWLSTGETRPTKPRVHVAFAAVTRLEVDAFHRAAVAAGGADNGAPGLRAHYHPDYYGAFVIDPDGHNVEAVCHRP
mgnify:CR=1 FL=1